MRCADETRAIAARAVVKTRTRRGGETEERRETGRRATRWREARANGYVTLAYLIHSEYSGKARGVVLYATVLRQ